MLETVKSYLTLTLTPLMTLKETFLTGFPQHNKTFQHQTFQHQTSKPSRWRVSYVHWGKSEAGNWIPNRFPQRTETWSCRIHILLRHKPATDIRKGAQPASTPYPASTNKEPLRHLSINNQVILHVILLGIGGTIYNQYTITPLLNLGVPTHKVHQLFTKLHCHAIKSLNKITKTRQNTP